MNAGPKSCGFSIAVRLLIGGLTLFVASVSEAAERQPAIRYVKEAGHFELGPFPSGFSERMKLNAGLENVFSIRVVADDPKRPGMAGTHTWTRAGFLRFVPRFPLVPGLSYEARFLPGGLPESVRDPAWRPKTETLAVPALEKEPPAEVTAIYPTPDRLPENLLKFYLHFSRPMSRGEAYKNIQLLDSEGDVIELPFLELGEELWDADQRRFTLFFDPGRVKRGLKPNEEEGRPLQSGHRYTLVVKSSWKDAKRNEMAKTFRKTFEVIEADYTQPDPEAWKFKLPAPSTAVPLQVEFGEPLDHALLGRVLWVEDADRQRVPGTATVGQGETTLKWTPDKPWKTGTYVLVAEPILEDLAGNSLGRPFEEIESDQVRFKVVPLNKLVRRVFQLGAER